ncbi:hypothetical protein BDV96DRAFT_640404 [Lophiotrema nucula]|uniref:Uncharacterized protein n=1 Tax=Lophiotrema nucula TaxID=690887 RepID=A0A6A5ZVR8_9PLEO|nr:hypothetical protein BDV96DRAFT_640404 [Lophiotrema nucula]
MHTSYITQRDSREDATETVELYDLQDAPSELIPRQSIAKRKQIWQYLHPILWLLLLYVGGPVALHQLYQKRLIDPQNISVSLNQGIGMSPLPCNVKGVEAIWHSWDGLFEINIRTPTMTFTQAKMIDLACDFVAGRGGQAALAWIAYRVYTNALIRVTEKGQIRYDLFAAVTIMPNEARTFAKTTISIPSTRHLWAKFTLLWMAMAMLYLLAYPTAISAATTPVAATIKSIKLGDTGTAPILQYLATASYNISNSGIKDPWIVSVNNVTRLPDGAPDMQVFGAHSWGGSDVRGNSIVIDGSTYKLNNDTKITAGFYYDNTFYPFNTSKMFESGSGNNADKIFAGDIVCVPDGNRYQWGASWELLVLILIAHILWSTSMFLMWIEATAHSPLVRQGRKMSMWRAILDLARPLLMRSGPNTGVLDENKINGYVRDMSSVHYEMKVNVDQDGGRYQDVCLVSSSDTTVAEDGVTSRINITSKVEV